MKRPDKKDYEQWVPCQNFNGEEYLVSGGIELEDYCNDLESYCDEVELENHDLRCRNSTTEIVISQLYRKINDNTISDKQLKAELIKFYELSFYKKENKNESRI